MNVFKASGLAVLLSGVLGIVGVPALAQQASTPAETAVTAALKPQPGDFTMDQFHFHDGSSLPQLKLHYLTLGTPRRGADGHVENAVLVLHGTGGTGSQFMQPHFAGELFGPGQPLDASRYFIILPDNIGHGGSSKPSDGLKMAFPHYDYADMVAAQHELLTRGLKVDHLRLVMGTSMGCMHSFMWGEEYPDFVDAIMPLACEPVAIAGRNRIWRKMLMDGIRDDPAWKDGNYTKEPTLGLRTAEDMLIIAGSAPQLLQRDYPTRQAADDYLAGRLRQAVPHLDANDLLYQVDSSRNYDPSPKLGAIKAPLLWINSADDFINQPYLGIAEREIKRIPRGRYLVIPASLSTHGHGTHTWAALWKSHLVELLTESAR
jgi:homoserine O-acetyltransferase